MSTELTIAKNFDKTFKKYPFLFMPTKKLNSSSQSWPKYVSRNFNLISQKIDALLNANSVHDYVLGFSEVNSLSKIKARSLSSVTIEISRDIQFYSAGNTTQKLINPLKDALAVDDSTIEVDSIQFTLFVEQLVINFGIELCIALSELMESKRSLHNKNEALESI